MTKAKEPWQCCKCWSANAPKRNKCHTCGQHHPFRDVRAQELAPIVQDLRDRIAYRRRVIAGGFGAHPRINVDIDDLEKLLNSVKVIK